MTIELVKILKRSGVKNVEVDKESFQELSTDVKKIISEDSLSVTVPTKHIFDDGKNFNAFVIYGITIYCKEKL